MTCIKHSLMQAFDGDLEEFKRLEGLLEGEFDINWVDEYGTTFLHAGSIEGRLHVLAYLVEKGALVDKPDKYGGTALYAAVYRNHMDIIRLLLENEGDANTQPYD